MAEVLGLVVAGVILLFVVIFLSFAVVVQLVPPDPPDENEGDS
jgi:hypothetical protein